MPNYKGHLAGGFGAYLMLLAVLLQRMNPSFLTASEWLVFALAGALFPDIDIKSKGQKYFYRIVLLILVLLIVQQKLEVLAGFSVLATVPMLVRHRGIFHRLSFVIFFPLTIWAIVAVAAPHLRIAVLFDVLFFIVGAVSHLWLDRGLRQMIRYW